MPSWAGDAMAVGCAVAWAFAVLFFRRARSVDPAALNVFKNLVAIALLFLTMIAFGIGLEVRRSAADWARLVVSGVLGLAIADTLFLAGLRRVDAAVVALSDCAYAPTVLVLSVLLLGEEPRPGLWIGAPLVVLGLVIVAWEPRRDRPIDRGGLGLALAGVVTTAVGVVVAQPALRQSDLIEATAVRLVAGTAALMATQLFLGRGRVALSLLHPQPMWRAALPGAVLGTYVAMILWLGGMKYGTASRAALLNQTGAVFVLVLSRWMGEPVSARRWLGAAVALAGVAIVVAA